MNTLALALFGPLVVVNAWHGYIVYRSCIAEKTARSISESATRDTLTLRVHKSMHFYSAGSFFVYGYMLLGSLNMILAGMLLLLGAVFDAAQGLLLSKKTNHCPLAIGDPHQLTAWLMAACYLLFAVVYALTRGVDSVTVAGVAGIIAVAFLLNTYTKFRWFFVAQMIFFLSVSGLLIISGSV